MLRRPAIAGLIFICVSVVFCTCSHAQIPIKTRITYVIASQDIACPAGAPPAPTTSTFQALSDQIVELRAKLLELRANLRDLPNASIEAQRQVDEELNAIIWAAPANLVSICAATAHLSTLFSAKPANSALSPAVSAIPDRAADSSDTPDNNRPGGGVIPIGTARPAQVVAPANLISVSRATPPPGMASTTPYRATESNTWQAGGNVAPPGGAAAAPVKTAAGDGAKSTQATQCNKSPGDVTHDTPNNTPYSDCDWKLSFIGGVEQGAQSSSPSKTNPFLSVFTRAGPDKLPIFLWADVRLLGAPQAASTNGVISAVTDPAGNVTAQTFSTVGTSVDFMFGGEYQISPLGKRQYSISLIGGYGATTPLAANSLAQDFKSPAFGTVECNIVQSRFKSEFQGFGIIPGTPTNAGGSPACLVNSNSITSASGSAVTTDTPVTNIGFSNQDRTNFLGKWYVGVRTIHRYLGNGNKFCGSTDTNNKDQVGPCQRGVVDFLFGQDASVTGGKMHNFVFKVDAVYPLPAKSVSFLYLFGSASLRFARNINSPPLILQAGDIGSLTGNGPSAIPNAAVVVLPLTQPNKDFYRFGVGVDIVNIFKKLYASPSTNSSGSDAQKPAIASFNPSSANHGSVDFTLKVTGTGFVPNSKVQWGGVALTTTYISSTELDANVKAADITSARSIAITVSNTAGSASDPKDFTVN
jgi:hypothetical protein